ncbi:MAG: hypothetical protein HY898_37050 [Deltaproteobacteria bacterium]|nr:hypothetical protein [Deltaproteobacteria bacterium]
MSTNDKKDRNGADWDSAVDEWDKVTLDPSPAEDKTPPPPKDSEAIRNMQDKPEAPKPSQEPMQDAMSVADDDRTVVAAIPGDLLADSVRGGSRAAGLGQMFKKEELTPTGEDAVVTSAAAVGEAPERSELSAPVKPVVRGEPESAAEGEMLDPFADLREPAAARPARPAPPPPNRPLRTPPQPKAEPKPAGADAPGGAAHATDAPLFGEPLFGGPPESSPGPKLHEPPRRMFPTEDETAVLNSDKLAKEIEAMRAEQATLEVTPGDAVPPEALPSTSRIAAAPQSIPPAPLAEIKPQWPNERDCAGHLLEAGQRDGWSQRVAWMVEEATACEDPAEKASLLLAASEIYAMLAEDEQAEATAGKAREAAPNHPLILRQARSTALRDRQWTELLPALDAETRVAPTPEARAHGALLQAEIITRVQGEPDSALKQIEVAARVVPMDPRAHVEKFVRGLVQMADSAPKVHVPEGEELTALAQACKEVTRIRLADKGGTQGEVGPYEAIPLARAALLAFDTGTAAKVLRSLDDVRGLGAGATWLSASLASQKKDTRQDAAKTYGELAAGPHAPVARRMCAMRAAELGDIKTLQEVIETPGAESFSAMDRAALATLFGQDLAASRSFIRVVLDQPSSAPLGAAATAALEAVAPDGSARVSAVVGQWESRATVSLARSVLGLPGNEPYADRVATLREKNPDSDIGRLLQLECDLAAGRSDSVVGELSGWASTTSTGGEADRDRALASGLAAEALGDKERARGEYERALSADPANESCTRVICGFDKQGAAGRLADLARSSQDELKASVLLLEAALREGPESDDYDAHLRRAQELAPKLPFAGFLGERRARSRGDVDGTLEWLRLRRESTEDPVEAAYDQCREAMLMVEKDAALAASILDTASSARPSDMALRELYERFASERPSDWVSWRVERAAELEGADRARLLLEASLDMERSGAGEEAGKLARQAAEGGAGGLAALCAERAEFAGAPSTLAADALMEQARSETNQIRDRREARERLAELDEFGRNDPASAMLWHRAIIEESPQHLPSLRRLEHAYIGEGREEDFEPIASELAKVLQGPEADAHSMVAARIRLRESAWTSTRELVDIAFAQSRPSLWSLRESLAHSRAANDDAGIVKAATALAERADRDPEAAVLMMIAADAHTRMQEHRVASELMTTALEREPRLFDAHLRLIESLKAAGDSSRAAEELEVLARKTTVAEHRIDLWYRAAQMWLDDVKDVPRGRKSLEEASDIDIAYADVFQRLQTIYTEAGDRTELAALLERRLEAITDPQERVEMEVLRGKALADVGELSAAKEALSAALDASPDHVPALMAFAKLCADEDDWSGAEHSLIRLARHVPDADDQAEIYRQLGDIYVNHLPNMERAEMVLLEVLKRKPDDSEAQSRLVDVYRETGDAAKAIELCTGLLQRATTPEQKRSATIQLALIHEQVEGDVKKAETMLEKAHKESPTSVDALRALAELHARQNHQPALKMLLDRAANDARRSLGTGRFNPDLFQVLSAVGELRGKQDAALVAGAAIAALEGNVVEIGAGGAAVFKTNLDDLLAPPIITESFRNLLLKAGDLLETAFPIDLKSIRAGKFPPTAAQLEQAIQNTGSVFGLDGLEVFVSPAIGPTCIPVGTSPPRIVLGASLVAASEEEVRDFLILRALKILQVRGAVLSRTAPIDLLPTVSALIKCLAPNYMPAAVDQKRFEEARARITQHLPKPIPPELGALAVEVSGSIDNRISTVNVAVNSWGSRAALLASGSLLAAIKGIAWAGGHPSGPPASGAERTTWIGRNAEARELVVFTVSDAFLEARIRLGISQDQ